jgi:hypothetical protein
VNQILIDGPVPPIKFRPPADAHVQQESSWLFGSHQFWHLPPFALRRLPIVLWCISNFFALDGVLFLGEPTFSSLLALRCADNAWTVSLFALWMQFSSWMSQYRQSSSVHPTQSRIDSLVLTDAPVATPSWCISNFFAIWFHFFLGGVPTSF